MATGSNGVFLVAAGNEGNKQFGKVLKAMLISNEMTPRSLAEKAGIHPSFVRGIIRGVQSPALDTAAKLLSSMRCDYEVQFANEDYDLQCKHPETGENFKFYFSATSRGQNNRKKLMELSDYFYNTFDIFFDNETSVEATIVYYMHSASGDMLALFDDQGNVYNFKNIVRMVKVS